VASDAQIRLLLVEDVAQVAQYIRSLLAPQRQVRLLETLTDGRVVLDQIRELRPDVLIVDALLQGKVNGLDVAERVREAGLRLPIIVLTVQQRPVKVGSGMGIVEVLTMPFSGFDLINAITRSAQAYRATAPGTVSRSVAVHAAKGGVGTTTLAYNLAVSLGQATGGSVVLIDGSLRLGDLRGLLRVPDTAPSILMLPTDRIAESDLQAVLWRDPSGVDILLAPPRVDMVEMVTARDIEKVLSLLRRVYGVVVVDTPTDLSETTRAFLEDSDVIVAVFTAEWPSVRNARLMGQALASSGQGPEKTLLALNRAGLPGLDPRAILEQLGRAPDAVLPDDPIGVMAANAQGVPFVLAQPAAPVSEAVVALARLIAARPVTVKPPPPVRARHLERAGG
jgi:pilus assembly protein CpaE